MPSASTKEKIIQAAIELFNANGMAGIPVQQIAQEVGISPGNLAYHYKNKEAIVKAVCEEQLLELQDVLSSYRVFPNLIDFEIQLGKYHDFTEAYPNFFVDLLFIDRQYPALSKKSKSLIDRIIQQLANRLEYNMQRGIIAIDDAGFGLEQIAHNIWVQIAFWSPQQIISNTASDSGLIAYKCMIWSHLMPLLTEKGQIEFDQLIKPSLEQSLMD